MLFIYKMRFKAVFRLIVKFFTLSARVVLPTPKQWACRRSYCDFLRVFRVKAADGIYLDYFMGIEFVFLSPLGIQIQSTFLLKINDLKRKTHQKGGFFA